MSARVRCVTAWCRHNASQSNPHDNDFKYSSLRSPPSRLPPHCPLKLHSDANNVKETLRESVFSVNAHTHMHALTLLDRHFFEFLSTVTHSTLLNAFNTSLSVMSSSLPLCRWSHRSCCIRRWSTVCGSQCGSVGGAMRCGACVWSVYLSRL